MGLALGDGEELGVPLLVMVLEGDELVRGGGLSGGGPEDDVDGVGVMEAVAVSEIDAMRELER